MRKTSTMWMAAVFIALTLPAWGAGGGGGGTSGGPTAAPVDPDFKAGQEAVKKEQWNEAVARMNLVIQRDARNADAWNYLGYAYRHLGDMDNSFKHYERALQINPKHRGAHEYLGEAYLQVGNLAKAEEHLKVLDKLCWMPCEEYKDLKEKVADYKRKNQQASQ